MEVMSYLLLCVLFTLFQQGLGKHIRTLKDITSNNSIYRYIQKPNTASSVVMINLNEAPRTKSYDSMHTILADVVCDRCKICMQKAIKEHKQEKKFLFDSLNSRYDVLPNEVNRHKREISIKDEVLQTRKEKKHKTKKNKIHKTVTVTKYTVDGVVSVLKVKENYAPMDNDHSSKTTCEIYNVKQSYTCDSPEGELTVNQAKRKSSKKGKKEKVSTTSAPPPSTTEDVSPSYRKREAPFNTDPQLSDIISSVEDY